MKKTNVRRFRLLGLAVPLLAAAAVALVMLPWGHGTSGEAEATTGSPDLSINIGGAKDDGSGADCTTQKTGGPTKCSVTTDSQFTVNVRIDKLGANFPSGYDGFQARLNFSAGLTLKNRVGTTELDQWPDCEIPAEDKTGVGAGTYRAGCIVFFGPSSFYVGEVMNVDFSCGSTPGQESVTLDHGTPADSHVDLIADPDPDETLTINCGGVGGIAEVDSDLAGLALEAPEQSGGNTGLLIAIAAAVATGVVALGGAAWYTRKRVIS